MVLFLVLVFVFNFDLFKFSAAILEKGLLGNSEEEFEMTGAISIGWPSLIGKCRSILLRYSHLSLTGQFGIMESTQLDYSPSFSFSFSAPR